MTASKLVCTCNTTSPIRLLRNPFFLLLTAIGIALIYLTTQKPLCTLHRDTTRITAIPTPRTCADGHPAVDASGRPCIPLQNLTSRTNIYRASTPDVTYMYCSLPKNGCSFHIDMLHRVNGDYFQGNLKHRPSNQGKITLNDPVEAAKLLANVSVPKYMVIRNPLVRTLSGYLCEVEYFLPEVEKTREKFREWVKGEFTNFTSWKRVNNHWKAQTEFCGFDLGDVQKRFRVFRVEHPEEYVDFLYGIIPRHVLESGWGREKKSYREFVMSPHTRTGHSDDLFYEYVGNLETFDLLEKAYKRDIDVLGYREEVKEMRRRLASIVGDVDTGSERR